MKYWGILFLLIYSNTIFPVYAGKVPPWRPTASEIRFLPSYCAARLVPNHPERAKWAGIIGKDFRHMHHYCAGINFVNRVYKRPSDKEYKKFELGRAVNNFQYILTHTKPKFPLRADTHVRLGKVFLSLGNDASALLEFNKAIDNNPKYPKSYAALSDYYKKTNNLEKAREILENGIKNVPKSRLLKRRMEKINKEIGKKTKTPD